MFVDVRPPAQPKIEKAPYNGAPKSIVLANPMPIALLAPFGVRMPPPQLNKYFFHRRANMVAKNDFTKFFYI
jgi:hypothetical protein